MTAPDRPTREQVDEARRAPDQDARVADALRRLDAVREGGEVRDALTKTQALAVAIWLAAEVRAQRAELEQADHFGRGEFRVTQWAYDQAPAVWRPSAPGWAPDGPRIPERVAS